MLRGLAHLERLEHRVCVKLNSKSASPAVGSFFVAVSRLGDGVIWYSLMILMVLTQGEYGFRAAAVMGGAGLCGLAVYKILKTRLIRERPFMRHTDIRVATRALDEHSFPSGHTLHAVMFTTIAVGWFPALAAALIPLAVLIGLSRVVLGLHYPSDVVIGALIGWSLAEIALVAVPPGI